MSQERYGIRRFALLNTAGYSLGLFPLENPLSVYGANNLGKSASINALQFPILARMSDMSFGKYSLEQSRKFYFATDTRSGRRLRSPVLRLRGRAGPGPLPAKRHLPASTRAVQ